MTSKALNFLWSNLAELCVVFLYSYLFITELFQIGSVTSSDHYDLTVPRLFTLLFFVGHNYLVLMEGKTVLDMPFCLLQILKFNLAF